MIKQIDGNLLDSTTKYICHQCNCVTNKAAHLSAAVFARFPYTDIYANRTHPDIPGTIIVRGNGADQRFVINILGQYYPGKPRFPNSVKDGHLAREKYFQAALEQIALIQDLESIAFPARIGCGAAGGDWDHYLAMIEKFAEKMNLVEVQIVSWNPT